MSAIVLRGDAGHLPLPDASVDLIVTSPPLGPYFGLRSYTDGGEHYDGQIGSEGSPRQYIDALLGCTREWVRVLKPSGSLFVNLGDKYAQDEERSRNGLGRRSTGLPSGAIIAGHTIKLGKRDNGGIRRKSLLGLPWRYALGCVDDLGLILRAEIIWDKPNGLPESVTDRARRAHEQVFHLVKQPHYFAAVDEIREPHQAPGRIAGANAFKARNASITRTATGEYEGQNPLGKLPGSVWEIPSTPLIVPPELGVDHFAAFPMELPRRCILGWSPPSGVVLDPFGGTGTTALVAAMHGRLGLSFDHSGDYCRLARWRTTDPGERARALGVPKPPPVPEGQAALFDLESAS